MEPSTDNTFALVMPHAGTAGMQEFLNQFSKTIAEDEHAVMILDQAGWHGSNALAVPANVTLVAALFAGGSTVLHGQFRRQQASCLRTVRHICTSLPIAAFMLSASSQSPPPA